MYTSNMAKILDLLLQMESKKDRELGLEIVTLTNQTYSYPYWLSNGTTTTTAEYRPKDCITWTAGGDTTVINDCIHATMRDGGTRDLTTEEIRLHDMAELDNAVRSTDP